MTISSLPLRIAIYARYSSDAQNPSSIDDQTALCRKLIASQFPGASEPVPVYSDAAVSGATMRRPGLDALLDAVQRRQITMVVTEGLDRLSRSLKDIALLFETFSHFGVSIFTAHEGTISEIHVGLKGTMNALFLRDMKAKVKRGQSAKIAAGLSSSSCAYGYRVVYGSLDAAGRPLNGVRAVDETTAAVVRRIYREYAAGRSVKEIAAALNRDKIPSPSGKLWRNNTLSGSLKKQDGLLRNEIYTGKLIFNKSYVVRDPVTQKKKFVYNPNSEWTKVDVPHLRIVSDDLWQAVRKRDRGNTIDLLAKKDKRPPKRPLRELNSHNQHALTGYVRCGACGGLKNVANSSRYVCSANRYAKSCPNARGTGEADVRSALFRALLNRVRVGDPFRPLLLARFDAEAKRVKQINDKEKEILAKIDRLVDAVEQGVEETFVIQRIADHQRQLADLRGERARLLKPSLPSEAAIRKKFAYELNYLARREDIVEVRRALRLLRPMIVLTPIPGRRRGETIQVTVDDHGWPDFWRLIAK